MWLIQSMLLLIKALKFNLPYVRQGRTLLILMYLLSLKPILSEGTSESFCTQQKVVKTLVT